MIPDYTTVLRRRHLVTILVRLGLLLFAVWTCYNTLQNVGQMLNSLVFSGLSSAAGFAWNILAIDGPMLAFVALLVFLEDRLVRWIVPLPTDQHACPKCGYSLKNLNSPVCPECGTGLAGRTHPEPAR